MDGEDESAAYLKLFSEGTHNYLLHNSEDGLNDTFPVEPIFTEISSEWPSEGFPILLSGPLAADENDDNANVQLVTNTVEENVQSDAVEEHNTVIVSNNDVLLRINGVENEDQDKTVTRVINGNTYSITYTNNNAVENSKNVEVIQLLDIDGTITTIDKNALNCDKNDRSNIYYDNFYCKVQANKCRLCSFLCENEEDILTHIKIKHQNEIYLNGHSKENLEQKTKMTSILNINQTKKYIFVCSNCGNGYSNKEDLKQHMISKHNAVEISKGASDNSFPSSTVQIETKKKHSVKNVSTSLLKKQKKAMHVVKCSIKGCQLWFDKEETKKKHEECHVNENKKQFMCFVCDKKFSIWRICCMHLWKHHSVDLGLLTCPMCNKFKSLSAARVINHMSIHSEERPFQCSVCGNSFKQLNQLRNHQVSHQPPDEIPNWFAQKQCQVCDCYFSDTKSLKKHVKFVHDKFKPFICNICGHQTARKEMLQLHQRQHTGQKPFHCSYCDYKTGDKNCLRRHAMRHFGVAKYSCPHCNYTAIQASSYKKHLSNKHPGKEGTFSCSLCRYTTINDRSYLNHVKFHELEKMKKANNSKVEKGMNEEDSESKSSDIFLNNEQSVEAVDTGGITIPATFDLHLNEQTNLL